MKLTIDFSEVIESSAGLPSGVYDARIISGELCMTKAGAPQVKWTLQVFGAHGDLQRYNNWKISHWTPTTGKGAGFLKDLMVAAGIPVVDIAEFDTDMILGREVTIQVEQEKNEDGSMSKFSKVKRVKQFDAIPF